jgi:hypothetical protein
VLSDKIRQNNRTSPSRLSDDQLVNQGVAQLNDVIETEESKDVGASSSPDLGAVDIGTRLHLDGRRQAKNLLKLQQEYEDFEYQRTQAGKFKPTTKIPISTTRENIRPLEETDVDKKEEGLLSLDFHERQKIHLRKIKLKHAKQLQQRDEESKTWFHPKTLPKSEEMLLEKHPDRVFESPDDRIERLTQHHLMVR